MPVRGFPVPVDHYSGGLIIRYLIVRPETTL